MPPVKVPNYNKWNKPPTAVYEDNYGYGINFYQPMIDYITAKEHGVSAKPPHLPWNNERGLDKYRFDKPVKAYSEEDVTRISHEIAEQAKRDLNKFDVAKRSPFSVVATAAAANVTKHVGVESVTVKAKKKKLDREKINAERQKKRMDEIEKELELYEAASKVGAELRGKAMMYRGKSAKAIAQTLLEESRKNVDQARVRRMDTEAKKNVIDRNYAKLAQNIMSKTMESKYSNQSESRVSESVSETIRTVRRSVSPTTCIVRVQTEIPIIDNSYVQHINELKDTLRQFEQISTSFCIDTRWI
ncbi:paramyosin, short form-like [Ostrinia nubilalis]|uniref:paramyosin, short form-like n=1 Tax=Ostrinia nubilalis TaxID=29057 RepID=UPI0030823AC8